MSERLEHLVEEVDRAHATATSIEALARSTRDAVSRRIRAKDFLLDCVDRIVDAVAAASEETPTLRGGGPDLHVNERLRYRFKVFFWAPGFESAPHQHNTWGVTGVLHNRSSVVLYRNEGEPDPHGARLVAERSISAEAGEVGYLLPPCMHSVGNPGESISATFHVFTDSPDEDQRQNDTVWYPKPGGRSPTKGPRYNALRGCAEILARIDDARSVQLLERIFGLGGPYVKLVCAKAMAAMDPRWGAARRDHLRASLPDALRETLASAGDLQALAY